MKNKKNNAIALLMKYAADNKRALYKSIFSAIIGELFGMIPFLAIAQLKQNGVS